MFSKEILRALQTGQISLADAETALTNNKQPEKGQDQLGTLPSVRTEVDSKATYRDYCPDLQHSGIASKNSEGNQAIQDSIAIIGVSGQFPKSNSPAMYWENLAKGVDCISEVPPTRWSIEHYYDPDPKAPGKTYSKWLGVLEDADKFDPLFFNISPVEAELMDPQQRLFLENCWHCIEDAGLSPAALSGSRCGVFVGCGVSEYGQARAGQGVNAQNLLGSSPSILSARISYLLNLKGPCLAIDTACSSALVAIAEACNSLVLNTCDYALAGGVQLALNPTGYVMASKAGMFSKDGRCFTFDTRANGYVPGEGVGVVLLKRLADAVRDQDPIYGVIRGWGINQDGKTNGITAPSVNSQIDLEKYVYERFAINPETISMAEAHGTGTKLGDPIEVEALIESFRSFTLKKNYCALGSAKSNLGHLIKAAGIAGVIKILFAMKHQAIPPTINFEKLNEHINLESSPFYINTQLRPWEAPPGVARRACVSSFGFSGTNCHIVIEEYLPKLQTDRIIPGIDKNNPVLFVLSAKSQEQLKTYAKSMSDFIKKHPNLELTNITYTLQVGRQAMDHRLALLADSRDNLLKTLDEFIANKSSAVIHSAQVKRGKEEVTIFETDEDAKALLETWIAKKKLKKIAELWLKGLDVDWNQLYGTHKPQRLNLPAYPFARESYWIHEDKTKISNSRVAVNQVVAATLHPLLHQNTSDLSEQRFSSVFTGQEFFLADHVIRGQRVLPGVAYLEMARAAVVQAAGVEKGSGTVIQLKNVVWARPVVVQEQQPVSLHIGLYPVSDNEIAYEIYTEPEDTDAVTVVHSQGSAVLNSYSEDLMLDLTNLKDRCMDNILSPTQCYEAFKAKGIEYGPGHQGIQAVYVGSGQVLAKLSLPSAILHTGEQFVLHPSLMDSALQAAVGLAVSSKDLLSNGRIPPLKLSMPFALQELEVRSQCTPIMWAWIRYNTENKAKDNVQKIDIDLADEQGRVCVRFKGFASRVVKGDLGTAESSTSVGTLLLTPYWKEQAVDAKASTLHYAQHLVILCELNEVLQERIESQLNGVRCLTLQAEPQEFAKRFQAYAVQIFETIQKILSDKPKSRVLIQTVVPRQGELQLFSAISGLLRTARLENPQIVGQLIELDSATDIEEVIKTLQASGQSPADIHIQYRNDKRYVFDWREQETVKAAMPLPWKDQGVYLITGGAGALGLVFAKEIVQSVKAATLILVGRTMLNVDKQMQIKQLEALGAKIEYRQIDVTHQESVDQLVHGILEDCGSLDGIIHAAGVIRDNFIIKKNRDEFLEVLAPKVSGLIYLDQATANLPMDFLLCFSSGAAMGNTGQADYSTANAFMDVYAQYRNHLVALQQRKGRTLSINWPLWQEGGMQVSEEAEKLARQNLGMFAMKTATGIQALYQGMASEEDQVMVLEGDLKLLRAAVFKKPASTDIVEIQTGNNPVQVMGEELLRDRATQYLKKLLSSVIKLPTHKIEEDAPMERYGIDSIMVMQLTNELEKIFGSLSKTLFFEYQNIQELTGYFLESYREQLIGLLGIAEHQTPIPGIPENSAVLQEAEGPVFGKSRRKRFASVQPGSRPEQTTGTLDIAIIGISGSYPQAKTLDKFWNNLRTGKNCITEIPQDRWDCNLYFDEDKNKPGKSYSKWGGFLEGVDEFDPLFFNISPREAEYMDPQGRLFLQCVIETLEDAGYTRETLGAQQGSDLAGNVGVYVGVMWTDYALYTDFTGHISSFANRVSYYCNFHGPSLALDTMCSSSLTAIHLACQGLQRGDCETAIAGGVNVSVHPQKYLILARDKVVSSKNRSESFGEGDGYIPAEGVGAVLLKPLAKAIADRDNIHGIIKATAINHGGKTNGFFIPNPNAQARVIEKAFRQAEIDPRTISYVEAAAPGSALGDPIELTALTKAFRKFTADQQFCAIGSVKSNIGHAEAAAGMSQLTKVILQMRHKELVPSINAEPLNSNINFANTPFYLQRKYHQWDRPVVRLNGADQEFPRRAAVSSFGAGGSNAHVVIEEYSPPEQAQLRLSDNPAIPTIIVLSAKSPEQLIMQAKQLLHALEAQRLSDADLRNIAYTLQVGREAMEERVAMIVASIAELTEKLKWFAEGRDDIEDLYRGQVRRNKDTVGVFAADEDLRPVVDTWINKGKYAKLLDLWVKGLIFDWNKLYGASKPYRISLPTYPFARERYWVSDADDSQFAENLSVLQPNNNSMLHGKSAVTDDFYRDILQKVSTGELSEKQFKKILSL